MNKIEQVFYISPQAEVIEAQYLSVICQSIAGNLDWWNYNDNDL